MCKTQESRKTFSVEIKADNWWLSCTCDLVESVALAAVCADELGWLQLAPTAPFQNPRITDISFQSSLFIGCSIQYYFCKAVHSFRAPELVIIANDMASAAWQFGVASQNPRSQPPSCADSLANACVHICSQLQRYTMTGDMEMAFLSQEKEGYNGISGRFTYLGCVRNYHRFSQQRRGRRSYNFV